MCGRFTLTASPKQIADIFALDELEPFPPRYNIAPTQPILGILGGRDVRPDANTAGRDGRLMRWGLIPHWVKDLKGFPLLINARAETVAEKNAFRTALRYRRCLIPASGFYEWRRDGRGKPLQAYFLRPRGSRPVAFAGLMETYLAPDGSEIDTAAIVTTAANQTLRHVHDRMPVTIGEGDFERWLDCRTCEPAGIADLLRPAPEDLYEPVPVSAKVNKVANTGPNVQDRVETASPTLAETAGQGDKRDTDAAGNDEDETPGGPAQASLF